MSMMHKKTIRMKQKSLKERTKEKKEAIREKKLAKKETEKVRPLGGLLSYLDAVKKSNMNVAQKGESNEEKSESLVGQAAQLGRPTLSINEEGGSGED